MVTPTIAGLGAAAFASTLVGGVVWVTVLGIYLARSIAWNATALRVRDTWVPLPLRTLTAVAVVEVAASTAMAVAQPLGPQWVPVNLAAVATWLLLAVAFVLFGRAARRRMTVIYTTLARIDYVAAVEERRQRVNAAARRIPETIRP